MSRCSKNEMCTQSPLMIFVEQLFLRLYVCIESYHPPNSAVVTAPIFHIVHLSQGSAPIALCEWRCYPPGAIDRPSQIESLAPAGAHNVPHRVRARS